MEIICNWAISILILYFYIKVSYYFYKKDKMQVATLLTHLVYGFFVVVIFIFPYVSLLGKLGEHLTFSKTEYFKYFGGYLLGSAYVLGISAVMLAFGLLFLVGIGLIIKLLSDFPRER